MHFNIATPLAVMRALKQAGTRLLEPMLTFTLQGASGDVGRLTALLVAARAQCEAPEFDADQFTLRGTVPAATGMYLGVQFAHETAGRAQLSCEHAPYSPAPDGIDASRSRPQPDPCDEANFLLYMRGAVKSGMNML
jgi:ribosomal protection tetracycline resistance protein